MTSESVIALGLVNAGKSTYIAALGYVIQHEEVPTKLRLLHLADDLGYVNILISDWLKCKPFERTKAGVNPISFHLKDSSGPLGNLNFPDISGETFELHWELREWESEFAKLAQNASGILLFIHPLFLQKPFSVVDAARIAKAAGLDAGPQNTDESADASSKASEPQNVEDAIWKPKKASSQSKLVDFLQMVARNTNKNTPFRVGIMISAWDVVEKEDNLVKPLDWFKSSIPLLYQFVAMNPELFELRVFGVSAQGGDNQKDGDDLRKLDEPSKRVKIVAVDSGEHDITGPLAWVLKSNA